MGKPCATAHKQIERNYADTTVSCHQTVEKSRGRIEVRKVTVCTDIEWLQQLHGWAGLASIIMVEYSAEEGGKTRREVRFHIASLRVDASEGAKCVPRAVPSPIHA